MKHGIVTEISGPVVDVRFAEGELPSINEALTLTAEGRTYTMEVEQHLTGDTVRCIMMSGSDGLSRGLEVEALGHGIPRRPWARSRSAECVRRSWPSHRRQGRSLSGRGALEYPPPSPVL